MPDVSARRALEALRAGVPNRDVVRLLPPAQADIVGQFAKLLRDTTQNWVYERQAEGLLLAGEFGTGKTHWLEYFRHEAMEGNFVCSTVVLNKETPLYDLRKIFRACVESAVAPGKHGPALEEIAFTFKAENNPNYREFDEWIHGLPPEQNRIAASLHLFIKNSNEEVREKILAEWIGYPMKVPEMRAALKEVGLDKMYSITPIPKGLAQELLRFEFISRFFRAAGYSGWVILFDEMEMISKYSLRQRARSYAHFAWLFGQVKKTSAPGLAAVATITKDYTSQVLYGTRKDLTKLPVKLPGTRDEHYLPATEAGMKVIKGNNLELRSPVSSEVEDIYRRVREIYTTAYAWEAPELTDRRAYLGAISMRQYIRSWINSWDLLRLYQYHGETVLEKVVQSYDEDSDMQQEDGENE